MKESRNKLICGSNKKANTQLAIHIAAVRDQPVNACKRNSKKVEKKRTIKQMKLASYRWDSLTSLKTCDSCKEQPYERTQLAIAIAGKRSERARKNRNDPAQKWCCNETHKETRLKNHAARRTNKKKLHSQLAIACTGTQLTIDTNACKRKSKKVEKNRTVKQMKLASYTSKCRKRRKIERNMLQGVISRPYENNELSYLNSASKAEFNIIQLSTELISRRKRRYVRTQLAIAATKQACAKNNERSYSNSASKAEFNIIQLLSLIHI